MYKESPNVEFKRELTDQVKNEIIAFLNTKGGTIYIGVNDDGTINLLNTIIIFIDLLSKKEYNTKIIGEI